MTKATLIILEPLINKWWWNCHCHGSDDKSKNHQVHNECHKRLWQAKYSQLAESIVSKVKDKRKSHK